MGAWVQGVVHRDMKADNVFLSHNRAKVADFGLATKGSGAGVSAGQVGAYAYQSPEQARGLPYDGRNDVYALGENSRSEMACGHRVGLR